MSTQRRTIYLALEEERNSNGLTFQVSILNQRLDETRAELGEVKWPSIVPMTANEEAAVSEAVAREQEEERLFADRCFAAGDAAVAKYLEHFEEPVAQVGCHNPPCVFTTTDSLDIANMVGCTCSVHVGSSPSGRRTRERKGGGKNQSS